MWVEFQHHQMWQNVACLSADLSRQFGLHVWRIQQEQRQYIVKFLTSEASKQLKNAHQHELWFYQIYHSTNILLNFQIVAQTAFYLTDQHQQKQIFVDLMSDVLVLPYVMTLQQQLKDAALGCLEQKITCFGQVCDAVVVLHQMAYIHGDLKPQHFVWQQENIDIATIKLIDFAQVQKIDQAEGVQKNGGTPAYMAPELFLGHAKTIQTDIYALGIIFYQLLMGEKPFQAMNYQSWALQHCQQEIPLLSVQFQQYQHLLDRMLAKQTEHRFLDVQKLKSALDLIKSS